MKILIIQLARPGDIYSSWPALSALRRTNPQAEIHFLTRQKFASACSDFKGVDHFWTLDSKKILAPLVEDSCNVGESINVLRDLVEKLRGESFDKIINLSFSPASSYLAHLVSVDGTEVRGYTRSSDFYLSIPDEASQYFRSQVGVGRSNRIHLYDLFAMVSGVELVDADLLLKKYNIPRKSVVCHTGASQAQKAWPVENWAKLLTGLSKTENLVIVGGTDDIPRVQTIMALMDDSSRVVNLAGKTTFSELSKIISAAHLFIGADSGPLHVANTVGIPVLNLSVGVVNFWETGPTTFGSQILVSRNPSLLSGEEVLNGALLMLTQSQPIPGSRFCDGQKFVRYDDFGQEQDAGWPVVQWLYFKGEKPQLNFNQRRLAAQIGEVCDISIQQVMAFKGDNSKTQCLDVLVRTDEILGIIGQTERALSPLLNHFFCQKENIPPADQETIIEQTVYVYNELKLKIDSLLSEEKTPELIQQGESHA